MLDKFSKYNNYAFIDSQNLNLGVRRLGWKLDFKRFRNYLREKYFVKKAFLFIGFLDGNQDMYRALQEYGYVLIFKPVLQKIDKIKGNCDAELVLQAAIDINYYDKAIIVTSDGDFYCLANYLYGKNKLGIVLSPCKENCSVLLRKAARAKIIYINNLQEKLEYKNKKHR